MRPITYISAAIAALSLVACQPFTPTALQQGSTQGLGGGEVPVTLTLGAFDSKVTRSGYGIQTVPTYEITQARIEISGPGFVTRSATLSIEAGTGSVTVNVPMGPNRVFMAYGLRTNSSQVPEAVVGAVKTIEPGENDVKLTWLTTPVAQAFSHFLQNSDTAMATNTNPVQVQSLVNNMLIWGNNTVTLPLQMHASLVDGARIGQEIRSNGGTIPGVSVNFVKAWGRVSLRLNGLPDGYVYDAWIEDPASPMMSNLSGDVAQTLGPVRAGTWKLHIVIKDENNSPEKRIEQEITLANGQTRNITVDLAGPSNIEVDFRSYEDEEFPDLSVPTMQESDYRVTVS